LRCCLFLCLLHAGQAETIFQRAILEQGRGRVLDTLAEIQERNRAVKDLEASLLELHQIFLDMAVLVEAQGEMLDNIEQQVLNTGACLAQSPLRCASCFQPLDQCFASGDKECWGYPGSGCTIA
jgi:hypothetical protein